MNLPSDSDESDVDFVPDEKHCSEEDSCSDDLVDETENGGEEDKKGKKRSKRKQKSGNKKTKTDDKLNGAEVENVETKDDKKREDELWAFLNDPSDSKSSQGKSEEDSSNLSAASNSLTEKDTGQSQESCKLESSDVPKADSSVVIKKASGFPIQKFPARSARGGLSSVLTKIGKNNKLSTLEKSKNDWNSFKRTEGIEEEISIHNRGRDGYLERQDFLQRTDFRQFEIEKNMRTTKRSNR